MFSAEDGAMAIINKAVDDYERHFMKVFPLYEYTDFTKDRKYDFSVKGAVRLKQLLDKAISDNVPIPIPNGYSDRVY